MASPTPVQRLRLGAAVGALATLAALAGLPAAAAATDYSPPHLNESYVSETHFDDKGMGLLYGLAVDFLRAIQQPEPLPPSECWHHGIAIGTTSLPTAARHCPRCWATPTAPEGHSLAIIDGVTCH